MMYFKLIILYCLNILQLPLSVGRKLIKLTLSSVRVTCKSSISVAGECASALTAPFPNADVSTLRNFYFYTLSCIYHYFL